MPDNNRVVSKQQAMTEALRKALAESGESLYAVAKATGLNEDSLSRFLRGRQSLRLDLADRLAAHLGIEVRRKEE